MTPQQFDKKLDDIQFILMSILVKIGPFFVALMPAMFTAYSIYNTFKGEAGILLASLFAFVVGLAIETVGIVATHTAIDLYNAYQKGLIESVKFKLMAWLVPTYVICVASIVWFSGDAFTPLVKGLGIASPFLTGIVYIAVALARDLFNIESKIEDVEDKQLDLEAEERQYQREQDDKDRQHKRDQKTRQTELKHAETMSKISVQIGQPTVQKATQIDALDAINVSRSKNKNKMLDTVEKLFNDNPEFNRSAVARELGVVRQTIGNHLDELESAGRITRNGNG